MKLNFSWKFHQKVLSLTISFIVLNDSIEFVLIYRPHPVLASGQGCPGDFKNEYYNVRPGIPRWILIMPGIADL
jgi:hypothetical protein